MAGGPAQGHGIQHGLHQPGQAFPAPQPQACEQHGASDEVKLRVMPARGLEALQGLLQPAQVLQHGAAVQVRLGECGVDLQGAVVRGQRGRGLAQVRAGDAQREPGMCGARCARHGLLVAAQGFLAQAQLLLHEAQVVVCICEAGVVLHGLLELRQGGAQIALEVQSVAQVVACEGVFGPQGQGLTQGLRCRRVLAQLDAHHAQLHEAGMVCGRQRKGLFVPGRGLSQTAGRLGGLGLLQGRQLRRWFRRFRHFRRRRGGLGHGVCEGQARTVAVACGAQGPAWCMPASPACPTPTRLDCPHMRTRPFTCP